MRSPMHACTHAAPPQDKHQSILADQEEQRRLDTEMEVERLRALEAYQVGGAHAGGMEGVWWIDDGFAAPVVLMEWHPPTSSTSGVTPLPPPPPRARGQNRDKQRLAEQQRGAAILREQLAERERQRMAAEELRDQVGGRGGLVVHGSWVVWC
jgi:hypothetical protein